MNLMSLFSKVARFKPEAAAKVEHAAPKVHTEKPRSAETPPVRDDVSTVSASDKTEVVRSLTNRSLHEKTVVKEDAAVAAAAEEVVKKKTSTGDRIMTGVVVSLISVPVVAIGVEALGSKKDNK